jgi:hypothetical protein
MKTEKDRIQIMDELNLLRKKRGEAVKRGDSLKAYDELLKQLETAKNKLYENKIMEEIICE